VIFDYFAPCTLGLEEALVAELNELGAGDVVARRAGAAFRGDRALRYRANLWLRTAIRVQRFIKRGPAPSPEALYDLVLQTNWRQMIHVDQTFAIDPSVRDSKITHSQYAAQKTKDAIVDQFLKFGSRRPSVDRRNPDIPIKLHIHRDEASLYLNLSGPSLHKRGWRPVQVKSPLNESIAAGLLMLAEWDRESAIVDPMCGSGTFLIEAAHLALDRAPGLRRSFAFERMRDFDADLWREIREQAERRAKKRLPFSIMGADRHGGALRIARDSAQNAGVSHVIQFASCDVSSYRPAEAPKFVITNPPYGERIGEGEDLEKSWFELGQFLKQCSGATSWVLSGNKELPRKLGLKSSRRIPVKNGPIDCRLLRYEIR